MQLIVFLLAIFVAIFIPHVSFAWGPGIHIDASLSVLSQLPDYLKLLLTANVNEFLYGCLAPDFIVGKSFAAEEKHSHNWDVGFQILKRAKTEREKAFAYGYLAHLAQDAVAHGIFANNLDKKFKNARHVYFELVADNLCNAQYKNLARTILKRYNSKLDDNFKDLIDSVLFSFGVSKLIYKGIVKSSLGKNGVSRLLLSPRVFAIFSLDLDEIKGYITLSKEFSYDVLTKGMSSPVVNFSAISE